MGNAEKALRYYRECYERNDASLGLGLKIVQMELVQKQFASAETLAVALQNRHGEKAGLYDLRGVLAMAQGDTAAALDFFGKAIAVDSLFEDALRNAAQVYLQRNNYGKAVQYYKTLYRNSEVYKTEYGRTLAMLYYYNRRFADAVDLIMALLESSVDDAELHLYLGLIFAAQEKKEQAGIEIEKAIALREDYAEAWRELFNLSIREKNYDRAFETAERYRARSPQNSAAWRLAGYALSLKKEYPGALSYFAKAVTLDSMDAGAWFELGSCSERSGDISHAADAFRRVLRLHPGDPAASNYLGYMWAEKGIKLDSAKVLVESALSRDPDNGAFLDSYAWIFYQQGNIEMSYQYIMEAVARIHNDPVVFEHLGDILHKRNTIEDAMKAYVKSLEYNPDNAEQVRQKIIRLEALRPIHHNGGK
jgi:tetratricopeptide (TPR) repeat protein